MVINKDVETSIATLSIFDPLQDRKQGCSTYPESKSDVDFERDRKCDAETCA